MTIVPETRLDHKGKPYQVVVPIQRASEASYRAWIAVQLREFLYQQGCPVEHISDEQLLAQTRNTFANTRSREGRITSAKPLQSG